METIFYIIVILFGCTGLIMKVTGLRGGAWLIWTILLKFLSSFIIVFSLLKIFQLYNLI